jgi:hypothetical protein
MQWSESFSGFQIHCMHSNKLHSVSLISKPSLLLLWNLDKSLPSASDYQVFSFGMKCVDYWVQCFIPTHATNLNIKKQHKVGQYNKSHLTTGTEAMGNIQHMSIICQSLSQIFRQSIFTLLQNLSIMTTLSYYMATDCIKIRKQITILNIYRFWDPYDVVPKQSLLDWMDKETVDHICYYKISLKHSSVYTIFNFKYIKFPSEKMEMVHDKQHSTDRNHLETFQKTLFKIQWLQ